jgi:aspartyl protease family protein
MKRLLIAAAFMMIWEVSSACTRDSDCDWKCFIPRGEKSGACANNTQHLKQLQAATARQWQQEEATRLEAARQAAFRQRLVVVRRDPSGHYIAEGRINGMSVLFMVDTGATDVALPLPLARRLGLSLNPGGISHTANGLVESWSTRLNSVDLGGLVVRDVRASVLPNMPDDGVLLGMSYLENLEMSQQGDSLTLRLRH